LDDHRASVLHLASRPFVLDIRLLVSSQRPWQGVVEAAIALLDRTLRFLLSILLILFLDAVRIPRDVIDGTARLRMSLVGDHAGDAIGCDFVEPGLFLGGYGDDRELGGHVSIVLSDIHKR
jgi:hypothetical protein